MTVYTLPLWESVSGFTVAAPLRLDGIKESTARDRRSSDVRGRTAGRRTRVLAAAFALARAGLAAPITCRLLRRDPSTVGGCSELGEKPSGLDRYRLDPRINLTGQVC